MKILATGLGASLLSLILGGSTFAADPTKPTKSTTLNTAAADTVYVEYYGVVLERLEKDTVDFSFPKGLADLSSEQKASLDSMVPTIHADKNIDRVVVVAWSDKPYPAAKGQKRSDADRKLAEKRANSIHSYLKDKGIGNIDVYNMAEKPSWIAKVFHSDNAQFKGANKSMDGQTEERIRTAIENKGGPAKAIVFFKREWKNKGMGT